MRLKSGKIILFISIMTGICFSTHVPLDSILLFRQDSLIIYSPDTGHVNVSNIAQYLNTAPGVNQISVSFTGMVTPDPPRGYNNRYLEVSTEVNGIINFLYRKYNNAISGAHYINAAISNSNFWLRIYIKHYVNHVFGAYIKLYNIRIRRLF